MKDQSAHSGIGKSGKVPVIPRIINFSLKEKSMVKESGYGKGLIKGFLIGGTVVGLVSLFFVPKSGKKLRKDIKDKFNKNLEEAEKFINEGKLKAKDLIDSGLKIFSSAKAKTGSMVLTGKDIIDNEKNKIKTSFRSGVEEANSEAKNLYTQSKRDNMESKYFVSKNHRR
jgi:gas vesicle protein